MACSTLTRYCLMYLFSVMPFLLNCPLLFLSCAAVLGVTIGYEFGYILSPNNTQLLGKDTILQRRRKLVKISKEEVMLILRAYKNHPTNWNDILLEGKGNLNVLSQEAREIYNSGTAKQLHDGMSIKLSILVKLPLGDIKDEDIRYLIALRPWSFTASITPVVLGSALAYKATGHFSLWVLIITLLTALSVHAAGNLVNTYFDYQRGIDGKSSDDRTLVDHILNPEQIQWLGMVFYSIGIIGFVMLYFTSSAKMEHLALMFFGGLSSSFLYTGGLGLKYMALGDIIIFLTFGPLTVMFAFLTQAGELSLVTLLYALPIALNTEAILHANNTRDMASDQKANIVTVAILLDWIGSYVLFIVLLFVPFLLFIQAGLHLSKWMFLPVITVREAFNIEKKFRRKDLVKVPQRVAKLNFQMGILYLVAVVLTDKTLLPTLL